MDLPITAFQVLLGLALLGLALLSSNLALLTLIRWSTTARAPRTAALDATDLPRVLVQLPLFNEGPLVERLLAAVAALDWPRERLEVQVLDDSTDGSVELSRRAVAAHREAGLAVELIHRLRRDGFKAGALAAGLARSRAEYAAVLDADFIPPADFLRRLVPILAADPRAAFAQARWGHINRDHGRLTRAQATLLDAHFKIEQEARHRLGLAVAFNGTCGVWRTSAIASAGGWQGDTLSEDLDLAIRAHLAGWRGHFVGDLEVPGELPESARAWRTQQSRWTKGYAQCAVKLVPRVWRSHLPVWQRVLLTLQVSQSLFFPLGLLCIGASLPLMAVDAAFPPPLVALGLLTTTLGVGGTMGFLAAGQLGRPGWRPSDVVLSMVLASGLLLSNTRSVLAGLAGRRSPFVRTPKSPAGAALRGQRPWLGLTELATGLGLLAFVLHEGVWSGALMLIVIGGLLSLGLMQLADGANPPWRLRPPW